MKTLKDLHFKKWDSKDLEPSPAHLLTLEEYLTTKEVGETNAQVPISGLQCMRAIITMLDRVLPERTKSWGGVYVYRSKYTFPGYVERLTASGGDFERLLTSEVPITDLCFKRAIALVDVIGNDEFTQRIAIKYEAQSHIEVAYGFNVRVCQNFNIFNGKLIRISIKDNVTLDDVMKQLEQWLQDLEANFKADLKTVADMMSVVLTPTQCEKVFGELTVLYHRGEDVLNLTQCNAFSRQYVKEFEENKNCSVWELMNCGTQVLKFDDNTGDCILNNIQNFSEYMFGLTKDLLPKVVNNENNTEFRPALAFDGVSPEDLMTEEEIIEQNNPERPELI